MGQVGVRCLRPDLNDVVAECPRALHGDKPVSSIPGLETIILRRIRLQEFFEIPYDVVRGEFAAVVEWNPSPQCERPHMRVVRVNCPSFGKIRYQARRAIGLRQNPGRERVIKRATEDAIPFRVLHWLARW